MHCILGTFHSQQRQRTSTHTHRDLAQG